MNKLERLFYTLKNKYFSWVNSGPDPRTIDISGIAWSDYPKIANGWLKGFLLYTPSRDIFITVKHSHPSVLPPNNKIIFFDKFGHRIERKIIEVVKEELKIDKEGENIDFRGEFNYFSGGDISICKLNEPVPSNIRAYKICTNKKILNKPSYVYTQNKKFSKARAFFSEGLAWIFGKNRDKSLQAGDSGLPWFVWTDGEWKVLTITSRGSWGEGPFLGDKVVYDKILEIIDKLSINK